MTVNQAKCLKNDVSGYWSCPDETNLVFENVDHAKVENG